VYEGVQLRLNKRVAIKLMSHELATSDEALARFRREAEVTSHLGHPHLVNVMDFGTSDTGEPYLVMEYLDGEDLDRRIRRDGRLSLETAVAIARQVASAVAAAHDEGIVHRDLKPANVSLVKVKGEADFVKVLDFGVSKIKASRTRLTRATAVVGTPEYMSPEQATGLIEEIDHRADQWALGCITWEMLSGHAPFIADDMAALFYQVINMEPHPLSRRAPGLPPEVESVLRRALAKQPADRYPSIKDFARAFEAAAMGFIRDLTPPPMPIPPQTASVRATVAYPDRRPPAELAHSLGKPGIIARARALAAPHLARVTTAMLAAKRRMHPARLKRLYFITGAAVALLVLALVVFWPRKPQIPASTAPTPTTVPKLPEVVTLPAAPSGASARSSPGSSSEPLPRTTKSKTPKGGTSDSLMKAATTRGHPSVQKKPSPF